MSMDRLIHKSIMRGDVHSFENLIEKDESMAWKTTEEKLNSILHLSALYGHLELSTVIVNRFPAMVSTENREMETPVYGACREGHLEIVKLFMEIEPWIFCKVNCRQESILFAACEKGKIEVVKHLLDFQQLWIMEMEMKTSSLHLASESGFTEIVAEILKHRPDLAGKKNSHGWTPLHLACMKGHLDITRLFLKLDSDLCLVQDCEGRNPLHWAVIEGKVSVVEAIIHVSFAESTEMITNNGESVLHLGVKSNQFEVVKYLIENINVSQLLDMPDSHGNTVLHLAMAGHLNEMVIYLLKIGVDANVLNKKGYTALDIAEADGSDSGALAIVQAIHEAGDIQVVCKPKSSARMRREAILNNNRHDEGLRNAWKTIAIVAVLIASVTFTAGINPPGEFKQESGRENDTVYKIIIACHIVALILCIGIVNILFSMELDGFQWNWFSSAPDTWWQCFPVWV